MLKFIREGKRVHRSNRHGYRLYSFWECVCGKIFEAENTNVSVGNTKSCGCLRVKLGKERKTHGQSKSKTYRIWAGMKERCDNPKKPRYKDYGGRGITYQQDWGDFKYFLRDMGERPQNLTLDRIDNNGNYCKNNCRWATMKEQASNTRANRFITYGGETKTLKQLSEKYGIPTSTIFNRLKAGWEIADVFEKKLQHNSPKTKKN